MRLNQAYPVGPSKSLKVFAGDKVDLEVWAYHENSSGYGTSSSGLTAMITAIASSFGGVSGGGGESGSIYNGVSSALNGFGLGGNPGDSQPAAYLNYILFDQNYKVMDMGWQRVPSSAFFSKQLVQISNIQVKEAGYLFAYLSYEDQSNNYVQFDDFKITHTKTNVIQYNEYYPFGLNTANSWTRENVTGNTYTGNSGSEQNATTGLYETYFRGYDAALGRFAQVDPLASKYHNQTPYQFGNNDPVYWSDPSGAGGDAFDNMSWTQRADAMFAAGNAAVSGIFGTSWSIMAYGSAGGEGGSAFARYGPGDGGALDGFAAPISQRQSNMQAVKSLVRQALKSSAKFYIMIYQVENGRIIGSRSGLDVIREMGTQNLIRHYISELLAGGIRGNNWMASLDGPYDQTQGSPTEGEPIIVRDGNHWFGDILDIHVESVFKYYSQMTIVNHHVMLVEHSKSGKVTNRRSFAIAIAFLDDGSEVWEYGNAKFSKSYINYTNELYRLRQPIFYPMTVLQKFMNAFFSKPVKKVNKLGGTSAPHN